MLELNNMLVRYGKHLAVDGVNISVEKGEVVVVLGANGAGKSSILKAIAGMVPVADGTISLDHTPITGMPAHQLTNRGIALVPEGRGIIGRMTVEENLRLGATPARARDYEDDTIAQVYDIFPRLHERKRQFVHTMSGGEQQMVAIGRAMMSKPDFLLLDEPSLGLAPIIVGDMFKALARVRKTGVGLLIVEQNVKISLRHADRGYLLEAGRITGSGTSDELMNDAAVRHAFLGGDI
ncbi:amino acid/amide ABC transporter ATP-binding protein 2 (HAAT family) [Pacificibacter maritimus]|uniref:Amino acid/amide ABC transporter ATP-binding protein 2 (HAAT family) n=1 Tax=Pacificibacter maritimus TaxID=762213 RepID=A0A3N4UX08_9RHOB|nr:ABC transporter ATP-binding protein [Pacificibacter maritimus]RPE72111.1 amino acid/amide ABC transporter ATP-binding protein 2 (HAAT family) [Pacificibacter maritimus]